MPTLLLPTDRVGRRIALIALIDAAGTGSYLSGSAVYFTERVGLDAHQIATGLSLGGVCGLLASLAAGRLADRYDPRRLLLLLTLLLAAGFGCYLLASGFAAFIAVSCVVGGLQNATHPVRATVVFTLLGDSARLETQAATRALFNVGFTIGTATGALALAVGGTPALEALVVVDAASFLVCAFIVFSLPSTRAVVHPGKQPASRGLSRALGDGRFLAVVALSAWLMLSQALLGVGIPLWVLHRTHAPHWSIAMVLFVNTAVVALSQVRVARWSTSVAGAARSAACAGLLLGAATLLLATTSGSSGPAGVAMLLLVALAVSGAEMFGAAAGFFLAFTLPPEGLQGTYQGVFSAGIGVEEALGPYLVTSGFVAIGVVGCIAFGAACAVVAALTVPIVTWAARPRRSERAPT